MFPAYFSCINNFNLSQSLLRTNDNHIVFGSLRDPARKAVDLSNQKGDLSPVL